MVNVFFIDMDSEMLLDWLHAMRIFSERIFSVCLAIMGGAAGAMVVTSFAPKPSSPSERIGSGSASSSRFERSAGRQLERVQVRQAEVNLVELSEGAPKNKAAGVAGAVEPQHDESIWEDVPRSKEEARARVYQMEEEELHVFEEEARDEVWADEAESEFRISIVQMMEDANRSGRLDEVECRTQHCIATLEWPSYRQARLEHRDFMRSRLGRKCRISSFMPSSVHDPDEAYHHRIIFDCPRGKS